VQRAANGFGEFDFLADESLLGTQPSLEGIGQRPAFLLSHKTALLGTAAAELLLDRVECSKMCLSASLAIGVRGWNNFAQKIDPLLARSVACVDSPVPCGIMHCNKQSAEAANAIQIEEP
jgi:hypothetical protein